MYKIPLYYALAKYRTLRRYWPGVAGNYKKLIDRVPSNKSWRLEYIDALYRSKQYKRALKEIAIAEEKHDRDSRLLILKLRCLLKTDVSEALKLAEKHEKEEAKSALFHKLYADILNSNGDIDSAVKHYHQAVNMSGLSKLGQASAYYHLGMMSNNDESTPFFQKSIDTLNDKRINGLGVGGLHRRFGNNQKAIDSFLEKVKQNPNDYNLWFEIGNAYSSLRMNIEARDAYQKFMNNERRDGLNGHSLNDKLIVFEAYRGRSYTCSPRAIYEHIKKSRKYRSYRFIWVLRGTSIRKHWRLYLHPRTKVVRYKSREYFRAYGHAKYWVTNARLNYIKKSTPEQVYLQCWHGTPLKRMGYSIDGDNGSIDGGGDERWFDNDTKQTDYLLAQSHRAATYFDSAFNLNRFNKKDILFESGYPRNDELHSVSESRVDALRKKLDLPQDKKIILYAPTWRDSEHTESRGYMHSLPTDFEKLRSALGDEWVILYRAHYLIAKGFDFDKYKGFIRDVSGVEEVNDLYVVSDVLMTDYSSVFFDYANLKRPIIFYMYDLDEYKKLRGFYFDLGELPGEIVKNENEIVDIIQDLGDYNKRCEVKYVDFIKNYISLDDGSATKRVVSKVMGSR